jgi:hypothetical protein
VGSRGRREVTVTYSGAVTTVLVAVLAIMVADVVLRTILRHERPIWTDRPAGSSLLRWLRVAVNVVGLIALFLVASTALSALLTNESGLTGDRLIWHVGTAPGFALAAVAVALFWAHRNRFAADDWRRATSGGWAVALRKLFFWIAVALAVPTFVSILAAMYPLTDTEGQQNLIRIHRYCGPLLAAAGFLFAYFAFMTWRERSQD